MLHQIRILAAIHPAPEVVAAYSVKLMRCNQELRDSNTVAATS